MNGGGGEATALSPEEAFALLGDGTRLQILQTLGEAGESLTFSELFDRVDYETTANFSYHSSGSRGTSWRRPTRGTPSGRPAPGSWRRCSRVR